MILRHQSGEALTRICFITFLYFFLESHSSELQQLKEVPVDKHLYACLANYGVVHGLDLDEVHEDLASWEEKIKSHPAAFGDSVDSTNNIVLATLTLIAVTKTEYLVHQIPVADYSHTRRKRFIFESRLDYEEPVGQPTDDDTRKLQTRYTLQAKPIASVPAVERHVSNLWKGDSLEASAQTKDTKANPEPSTSLSARELLIRKDFEAAMGAIRQTTAKVKEYVCAASEKLRQIPDISQAIENMHTWAELLQKGTDVENGETARTFVFLEKKAKPSVLLESLTKASSNAPAVKKAERKCRDAIMALYGSFWHSEQRLLKYLSDEEHFDFWERIADWQRIEEKDGEKKIVGALLHVHSTNNFCDTCRHSLCKAVHPDGPVYRRLKQIAPHLKFFKVLGSFRKGYVDSCDGVKITMPNMVENPELTAEKLLKHNMPSILLKQVVLK